MYLCTQPPPGLIPVLVSLAGVSARHIHVTRLISTAISREDHTSLWALRGKLYWNLWLDI